MAVCDAGPHRECRPPAVETGAVSGGRGSLFIVVVRLSCSGLLVVAAGVHFDVCWVMSVVVVLYWSVWTNGHCLQLSADDLACKGKEEKRKKEKKEKTGAAGAQPGPERGRGPARDQVKCASRAF